MSQSSTFNQIYADQAIAVCTRAQAEQLGAYDHHRVIISGRVGILLTSTWNPVEEHVTPFVLTVVFHHADQHPPAPENIQLLVNTLRFQFRGQAR